jgi:hypothetical protein
MGTVKWFNATAEGAKLSYELVTTRAGKTAPENLRIG